MERTTGTKNQSTSLERGKRNPSVITLYEIPQAPGVSYIELLTPTKSLEIELSLREAENAIERVRGIGGGEPVVKKTRAPARMVAAMRAQGATSEEIVAGYPSLTLRVVELAEIWTAAHPVSGRPSRLSDLGGTVNNVKRFPLPLPPGKIP